MDSRARHTTSSFSARPVGENLAQYATESGQLSAVIVERELVGGGCSYYACMPSKALLRRRRRSARLRLPHWPPRGATLAEHRPAEPLARRVGLCVVKRGPGTAFHHT